MPSWPSRLLSGPSTISSFSWPMNSSYTEASIQATQQPDVVPAENFHSLPTVQTTPPGNPSARSSPSSKNSRHGRSVSHPFPSLFGSSRKADRTLDGTTTGTGFEALVDQASGTGHEPPPKSPTAFGQQGTSQHGEKELSTGRCATCDSMVRWPCHLDVYRCTVCLMINNLKPAGRNYDLGCSSPSPSKGETIRRVSSPRKVLPLSLERTRSLIDQCIIHYLQSRSRNRAAGELNHDDTPGQRPVRSVAAESDMKGYGGLASSFTDKSESLRFSSGSTNGGLGHRAQRSPPIYRSNSLASALLSSQFTSEPPTLTEASLDCAGPPPIRAPPLPPIVHAVLGPPFGKQQESELNHAKSIFRPLESYLVACLSDLDCLSVSFSVSRPSLPTRAASEGTPNMAHKSMKPNASAGLETSLSGIDAKTLLLGDFAENGMWWTGSRMDGNGLQRNEVGCSEGVEGTKGRISLKTPRIHWEELSQWYQTVFSCGRSWQRSWRDLKGASVEDDFLQFGSFAGQEQQIEDEITEARLHVQRTMLKASENLLRRPRRPLKSPEDCRFLLILLANPLLYPQQATSLTSLPLHKSKGSMSHVQEPSLQARSAILRRASNSSKTLKSVSSSASGQHSGIIKRILGLMANLPNMCHQYLIAWFSRFSEAHFRRIVELVGGFVTYRLSRQQRRKRSCSHDPTIDLIPTISGPGAGTSARLHAALGISGASKNAEARDSDVIYNEDWQIKAAAKVMSLLFSANNSGRSFRHDYSPVEPEIDPRGEHSAARQRAHKHGQILPTSDFYNTLLDYADLIADFESWEARRGKFSFCQYPMFLSIWAKIHIMEHDARRQMEVKAREAFFNSIINRKAVSQYLVLKVRRDCLVEDSLRGVSEVVGTGQEEIKKGLRIEFLGEEGVDAGGLRKEWFLLLVREVFDPEHGLFVYDEDSHYCYFNPNSFETSDQFFLVGVVMGLAIYNSTILDVALPPFAFRKLLASAPAYTGPVTSSTRPTMGYTLEDLAEFRPSLARGLQQLLEYEGNVEETFCRDFVANVDRYGQLVHIPLCPNGESRPVTNSNRREFVELYIQYTLDTAVVRQYEPFKRGFFTICEGNALSLFRPEEIELLVRGSDEPLDIASLRAVAVYENWGADLGAEENSTIAWFWDTFISADVSSQRNILSFITGSDRIPAMGATSLVIKVACLGEDHARYPIARTCFNMLGLYKYRSKVELEERLWRAVRESGGFGLK